MNGSDEENFRDFTATHLVRLRRLAYVTCGDWQLAEDAVCRSLAKLYRRWGKVSTPDTYVRTMVVRAAIDEVRRPWWQREQPAGDLLPDPPTPGDGPDDTHAVIARIDVRAALARLPVRQRAVLALRYLEGLSVQETAEALNCAEGTVTSYTARGLANLRQFFDVPTP